MMGLRKRNKLIKESTDVMIKLKISIHDVNISESSDIVDSLLNEILNAAWKKDNVELESLRATYMKEKKTK